MERLNLSASAIGSAASDSAVLIVSVTDDHGAPVTKLRRSAFHISQLAFATRDHALVPLVTKDLFEEPNGFYTMTLNRNTSQGVGTISKGLNLLAISVQKVEFGLALLGAEATAPVVAQGHVTFPFEVF